MGEGVAVGDGDGVGDGEGEGGTSVHVQVIVEGDIIVNVTTGKLPDAGTLPVPIQPEE